MLGMRRLSVATATRGVSLFEAAAASGMLANPHR